jgi:hypothetical protein
MLRADLLQRDDVTGGEVIEAAADGLERGIVREDLGALLEGFILVGGDQHRGRTTMAGDGDVLASIGHLIEQLSEMASQLSNGHRSGHAPKCTRRSTPAAG